MHVIKSETLYKTSLSRVQQVFEGTEKRVMKRNLAYQATQPVDEDIYDEVELPDIKKINLNTQKQVVKNPPAKSGNKLFKTILALIVITGIFLAVLTLITLIVTTIEINTLKQAQFRCSELPAPDNGSVEIAAGSNSLRLGIGSVATYSCNTGYTLIGQPMRFCKFTLMFRSAEITGVWNESTPTCQEQCSELGTVENGFITVDLNSNAVNLGQGSVVNYTCDEGYVLVGPSSRICEYATEGLSGEWSGISPSCMIGMDIDCHQTACRSQLLACPEQGSCNVNCNDSRPYACHQSSIQCPVRGGHCTVNCNSDNSYACLQTNMTCPLEGDCTVNCVNDYSCMNSAMICSSDGSSTINCHDRYTCRNAHITCPEGGDCNVVCESTYSCRDATITCQNNSNCVVNCTGSSYSTCYNTDIICPNNGGDCLVNCSGRSSCTLANIVCAGGKECVSCHGSSSCQSATFTFPGNNNGAISCTGSSSCYAANIMCPVNGMCNVTCTGSSSCRYANFRCADSENCIVNCNGEQSCYQATITCPPNSDCTINCNNRNGCERASVICPTGSYSCTINCTDPLSCNNLRITNTQNVSLQCCGDLSCVGVSVSPTSRACSYLK